MSGIHIEKISITKLKTDAVVNAANEELLAGGGVCGAIFGEAGYEKLSRACGKAGGCRTGSAVITGGFDLPAKYIIHAVGPIWNGGKDGEPELLYRAYQSSLELAMEYHCHSTGFPLISAGIYGYPPAGAWHQAVISCRDFIRKYPEYEMEIIFAVLDDEIMKMGRKELLQTVF